MKTTVAFLMLLSTTSAFARGRVDVSIGFVGGVATSETVNAAAFNPTLHLDLGAQLDPKLALFVRGEIGGLILANQAGAFAMAEWTPVRWISVGTGLGWDGMASASFGGATVGGPPIKSSWNGIAVPLTVGFNLQRAAHQSFRIELEAVGGYEPGTATWGWQGCVSFGRTWN